MLLRLLSVALIAVLSNAQIPTGKSGAASKPETDPLGRSTPRGTVKGFLRAAHAGQYGLATQFLELSRDPRVAKELEAVIDAALLVNLNDISDETTGRFDDGLPVERERIGTVRIAGNSADLVLHHVSAANAAGPIWLFSPETLRRIPELYAGLAPAWAEQFVPGPLKHRDLYGIQVWRLLALVVLIPLTFGFAWLIGLPLWWMTRTVGRRTPTAVNDSMAAILKGPLRLFLTVLLFHLGVLFLGLPLLFRQSLAELELVAGVFAVSWFALRLVDLAASETRQVLIRTHRTAALSMVPLGRRIVKISAVTLAVLAVLDNAGFDLKAILTGLGVGGIAVALAAQKTLENIFGGVALVADQPVRVGDSCKFGDYMGTVEDIGLRSTRIRTGDRTLISVPNASFSTMSLENFAAREKIFFHPTLALRMDTSTVQLRRVLADLGRLLTGHPKVETGARARLAGFGTTSLNVDVFSYILTADYNEFVVIQEDLLLRTMEIIEAAGTSLALPAQTVFLAPDRGIRQP